MHLKSACKKLEMMSACTFYLTTYVLYYCKPYRRIKTTVRFISVFGCCGVPQEATIQWTILRNICTSLKTRKKYAAWTA